LSDPEKQREHDAIEHEAVKENAMLIRQQEHKKCLEFVEMAKEQRLSQSAEPSVPPSDIVVPPTEPPVVKKAKTMAELSDEKEQRERVLAEQLE